MSLTAVLASLTAATTAPVATAPVAVPSVSFKFGVSTELRTPALLVADVYAVKSAGYVESLFASLESAGIQYRAPEMKMLIKIYPVGGKVRRVNIRTIGHPLSLVDGESITGWLDRVAMDERTKAIGIELAASSLTPAQVKHLHRNLGPSKYDSESTDALVSMFTFIAPPTIAPEVKQFARTVEHLDSVPLPVLRVPAGHVEPAAPIAHAEFVGDKPTAPVVRYATDDNGSYVEYGTRTITYIDGVLQPEFAIEPMVPMEPIVADDSVAIVELDSLEARTFSELKLLFKAEFRYNSPLNIRRDDLAMLINAKRDSAF